MKFTYLYIEAEYGTSGIWYRGSDDWGMLEYEDLGLPNELSKRFEYWIALYWARLPPEISGEVSVPRISVEEFNEYGRTIAKELKDYMGPDVTVDYIPEIPDKPKVQPERIE